MGAAVGIPGLSWRFVRHASGHTKLLPALYKTVQDGCRRGGEGPLLAPADGWRKLNDDNRYALHAGDNGRVVGYDNQHGYHHRHYFGVVAAVEFTSFDDIEDQFQADWAALRSTA